MTDEYLVVRKTTVDEFDADELGAEEQSVTVRNRFTGHVEYQDEEEPPSAVCSKCGMEGWSGYTTGGERYIYHVHETDCDLDAWNRSKLSRNTSDEWHPPVWKPLLTFTAVSVITAGVYTLIPRTEISVEGEPFVVPPEGVALQMLAFFLLIGFIVFLLPYVRIKYGREF